MRGTAGGGRGGGGRVGGGRGGGARRATTGVDAGRGVAGVARGGSSAGSASGGACHRVPRSPIAAVSATTSAVRASMSIAIRSIVAMVCCSEAVAMEVVSWKETLPASIGRPMPPEALAAAASSRAHALVHLQ